MVDTADLFKNLCYGAKFDIKRFGKDANRFNLNLPKVKTNHTIVNDSDHILDFFCQKSANKESDHNEEGMKKKKRGKKVHDHEESNEEEVISNGKSPTPKISIEQHVEKVSILRKANKIHVKGSDIPDPFVTFEDLTKRFSISNQLIKSVTSSGFTSPTPIQMQAIPLMISERELLACAPTGSGKTLAFILPIIHLLKGPKKVGFRAVIVSPTRELSQQIYQEFCRINEGIGLKVHLLTKAKASSNTFGTNSSLKCEYLYSTKYNTININVFESYIMIPSNSDDVLVTTPNRLVHLLNKGQSQIDLRNVQLLVLDEGDKLFEAGKNGFREQVAAIYQACDNPNIKRALFSATAANNIDQWCSLHLDNCVNVTVGSRNSTTSLIDQELIFVGQESGKLLGIRNIIQQGVDPPVLVFVQSKDRAKELFNELIYDGINVDVIHSDRTQAQRDNVVKSFRTGKIWILIATELMGRGIDFKGVNLVINYDFPPSAVSYIHRIGRTGRAGRSGKAITYFTEDDIENLRSIANVMMSSGCQIAPWMLKIKKKSRRSRKKLEKAAPDRDTIKTISKYDLAKNKRKQEMIDGSKERKKRKMISNEDL